MAVGKTKPPQKFLKAMANIRKNDTIVSGNTTLFSDPPLDTLAQLDNEPQTLGVNNAYETLQRRAFSKYYTIKILMPLIDLKNARQKKYWNTFHCCNTLEQNADGKIISKYCKNRWCIICNRIRSGILHNTHRRVLERVSTRFITLTSNFTRKCITTADLIETLDLYYLSWNKVWRNTKNKYGKLKCLRKTEVTYSFRDGWFHPHFHIILECNSDEADFVLAQWKRIIKENDGFAGDDGNHHRIADEGTFAETFKYLCKMYDIVENKKTGELDFILPYPAQKLDDIYSALKGRRIFQSYNLKDVEIDNFDDLQATIFTDEIREYHTLWDWEQELKTWVDYETGELRTEWKDFTIKKKKGKSKKEFNSE